MSTNRFVDNGDGTVTDTLTKLMWMKNDSYLDLLKFVTHPAATKYLNKKNEEAFAGKTDWRMPNKREAHSLFDMDKEVQDKYEMTIHIDPIFTEGCGYDTWTSHVRGKITAYCYSFNSGTGGHKEAADTLNSSVRLVRGEFDNSKTKITSVPAIRDKITQGGGWR
jgi:hypothetical protein